MRKISFTVFALFVGILGVMAQKRTPPKKDTTTYEARQLSFAEANLVSGYYKQTGNHAAVTGGIGSEALTDFANNIQLKFSGVARNGNKHSISLDMGIDHYTSASSDKIDPRSRQRGGGGNQTIIDSALLVAPATRTSASYSDERYYPSANWSIKNPKKHWTLGIGASYSTEWDYTSRGVSASFTKSNANKNREWGIRTAAFFDTWSLILPVELRTNMVGPGGGHDDDDDDDDAMGSPRNTFEASLSLLQVINRRLQLILMADLAYQDGYLATSFNRVFFEDASMLNENLPGSRLKTPLGIRANYFAGDRLILRSYYRFYRDDWGMKAHTASLETAFKVNSNLSINPNYRFHAQTGIKYFAPYKQHTSTETYFSSDYDLSGFNSQFWGAGLRYAPSQRSMIPFFNAVELRAGHFRRSDGLKAWILSAHLRFK